METPKSKSVMEAAVAEPAGWTGHVGEALKTWKGAGATLTLVGPVPEGLSGLASRIGGRAVILSVRVGGDASGRAAIVFEEAAGRAALGLDAGAPIAPVAEELAGLFAQRIASAAGLSIDVAVEGARAIDVTPEALAGAGEALPAEPRAVWVTSVAVDAKGEEFAVFCIADAAGLVAGPPGAAEGPPHAGAEPAHRGVADESVAPKLDIIMDVELPIVVRLGEAELTLEEVIALRAGSIIELNKQVDDPAELMVNNKVVAYGEVVVVQEHFGLRITRLAHPGEETAALVP
jgi:flagellar motor switch protein FliN